MWGKKMQIDLGEKACETDRDVGRDRKKRTLTAQDLAREQRCTAAILMHRHGGDWAFPLLELMKKWSRCWRSREVNRVCQTRQFLPRSVLMLSEQPKHIVNVVLSQ